MNHDGHDPQYTQHTQFQNWSVQGTIHGHLDIWTTKLGFLAQPSMAGLKHLPLSCGFYWMKELAESEAQKEKEQNEAQPTQDKRYRLHHRQIEDAETHSAIQKIVKYHQMVIAETILVNLGDRNLYVMVHNIVAPSLGEKETLTQHKAEVKLSMKAPDNIITLATDAVLARQCLREVTVYEAKRAIPPGTSGSQLKAVDKSSATAAAPGSLTKTTATQGAEKLLMNVTMHETDVPPSSSAQLDPAGPP